MGCSHGKRTHVLCETKWKGKGKDDATEHDLRYIYVREEWRRH